jgi:SAM-dependent methyltransferase
MTKDALFARLVEINQRPEVFGRDTVEQLWTEPHRSAQMLRNHLDGSTDASSRTAAFIERSVRWISDTFRLGPGKQVTDLGCGPGLYTNRLARTGASVLGVDFSARSIEHARREADQAGLAVEYVTENYLAYRTDRRSDLVMMIFCDFCALGPAQRRRLLSNVRAMLKPGGHFLFDVHSLVAFHAKRESAMYAPMLQNGFWSPDPYFGFLTTFKYDAERVTLDRYEIVEENGASVYYNWLQHYDPPTLAAEVAEAGLTQHQVLGDVAGTAYDASHPEFAVIARQVGAGGTAHTGK